MEKNWFRRIMNRKTTNKQCDIHVVIASNCKYCDNKLCDAQRFNNSCFNCGKKPI